MQKILIHGLGQNSTSWDKTISYIEERENINSPEVFSFLEGKEVSYENLYKGFSQYCNNIEGKINLCGLSLGGILALNYTIDYPEKVNSLILVGAQCKMPKWLLKAQNIAFRFLPTSTFKSMGMEKKDVIKLTHSMMDLDFSNSLKKISCPSLVICGEKDSANKKAAKDIATNIVKCKIKIVEGAKHEVNMDAPKELAEIVSSFYSRHAI